MAITSTNICNMALSHIQSKTINDLSENSPEAKACVLFYDNIRRVMLEDFDWSFARIGLNLPLHVNNPSDTQFEYQYVYPSQALAIRKLSFKDSPERQIDYRVAVVEDVNGSELKVLWCNFPDPLCVYTKNIVSNDLMSPKFIIAFSYRLAIELCTALNLEGRKAELTQFYGATMDEAQSSDANQFHDTVGHVDLADTMNGRSQITGYYGE